MTVSPAEDAQATTENATDKPGTGRNGPVDWDEFWRIADEARRESAHVSQFGNADALSTFFDQTRVPDDLESVGCGPAACPIELADRYPEMEAVGYDDAESTVDAPGDAPWVGFHNPCVYVPK